MIVCVCGVNPCFQGICDFSVFQYFSFSVLRQGVQAAHSVLHQRRHWMSAGDIWPDQSDVPAMRPFRFLNSVIRSQRRPYSICHCLKHVWVQRPFHEQKITNQYEPRVQTFCLTSVCEAMSYCPRLLVSTHENLSVHASPKGEPSPCTLTLGCPNLCGCISVCDI